ncbi:unnamed protein product, partial [Mesorhabditis spiculigera]
MPKTNLPWIPAEEAYQTLDRPMSTSEPGTSSVPPPVPQSTRRRYLTNSFRSKSFDGRLDLETLPEAHDEEAEEARLEAEEKRASEVRLRANPPDAREENNNQVDARCGERSKDTIRRPSHGTVRSIARHLSEKQKTRTVEERARLAKHRMSMPE